MPDEEIVLEHSLRDGIDLVAFVDPMVKDGAPLLVLEDELARILDADRGGPPAVCIDFSRVEFIATTVLAKLISFYKRIRSRKGHLVLCGLKPPVANVFEITNFHTWFEIEPDVEAAVARLRK
jgi:anti-sigma B factor antagonist